MSRRQNLRRRHRLYGPIALYGGRVEPDNGCEEMLEYFDTYAAADGDTTEVYRNIRVDDPSAPSEFAFKVPDGTVLKESLLEGISDLPGRTSPSAAPPR